MSTLFIIIIISVTIKNHIVINSRNAHKNTPALTFQPNKNVTHGGKKYTSLYIYMHNQAHRVFRHIVNLYVLQLCEKPT